MYTPRTLERHVLELSRSFPVLLLTGARQVGKTTLLRHLADAAPDQPTRRYVSLDHFGPLQLATEDPDLFFQQYPPPLILDEVQQAPQLLAALKPRVDADKTPGQYWLTGSQHFPLMRRVSESLAGRVGLIELSGLSAAEEHGRDAPELPFRPDRLSRPEISGHNVQAIFERIVRGSFPRFVEPAPPPIEAFYGSYLQTYIERDVRSMATLADLASFRRFLRIAATRVGQLLNLTDLARDTGIATSTASEWLSILEASYQVLLLRPFFGNLGKRQTKTPKLYFRDTGVACYLAGWTSAGTASTGAMAGELFESYVVSEIVKSYEHRGMRAPLWFHRTRDQQEVDLVIDADGQLFPIEIKLTARPTDRDLKGVRNLKKTGATLGPGAVICATEEAFRLDANVMALPVAAIQ